MAVQNLAVKLCGVLQTQTDQEVTAREWRILGQEQDGSQVMSWVSDGQGKEALNIGVFSNKAKRLTILHTFYEKLNIIQASVNSTLSLLVYIVKKLPNDDTEWKEPLYCPYLLCLLPDKKKGPEPIEDESTKQIMVQYVYGKSMKYSPGIRNDRFILFKHLEYIKIYRSPLFLNELDDGSEKWGFDGIYTGPEKIVKVFSWAQWDCVNQVLYYIHYRQPSAGFAGGDEDKAPTEPAPTLSALQFHADLPYETVMNIPLSLPHMTSGGEGAPCGAYEDDPIPLRVHDCSLDLSIVCDPRGLLAVCHHYLYKALNESSSSLVLEDSDELKETGVNFAYSVTLLHHGLVVHTVVPELPWATAKSLRPCFALRDNHVLVSIPSLYTHMIDASLTHEPVCHVVVPAEPTVVAAEKASLSLAPLLGFSAHAMIDLNTLDIVTVNVQDKYLAATFKNTTIDNKLAILHFLLLHDGNTELAEELIGWLCLNAGDGGDAVQRACREYLVAATHASCARALPAAASTHARALPLTHKLHIADVKVPWGVVMVSCEKLWCGGCVVLAPRQRVAQWSEDVWTRVYANCATPSPSRLSLEALHAALVHKETAYQPEVLSRCSTPLSPGVSAANSIAGMMAGGGGGSRRLELPFVETDVCTVSRQEVRLAATIREVSLHLVRGGGDAEGSAHTTAARWAAAQVDAARALCRALCRAVRAVPTHHTQRGFSFVDDMDPKHASIVFKVLEQYYCAVESISFPLPQGFASFFTYLGYRTLPFHLFAQYVHRNAFELHIDVMKHIISLPDSSARVVGNKLRLLQVVGEGRARRLLAGWGHDAARNVRARDHAAALLAGRPHATSHAHAGLSSLPAGERLAPLDSFLALLTAKASLNELDFNLIIEATLASLQRPH